MRLSRTLGALGIVLSLGLGTALALGTAGELDSSFGTAGEEVVRDLTDGVYELDARYLACRTVGGEAYTVFARRIDTEPNAANQTTGWAVTRHLSDGSLDTDFGAGGEVVLFGGAGRSEPGSGIVASDHFAHPLAIDPDGKVLLVGRRATKKGKRASYSHVLVRLDTDGGFDDTFGDGGIVDLGTRDVSALALEESTGGYEIVIAAWDDVTTSSSGGGKKKKGGGSTSPGLVVLRHGDTGALVDSFSDAYGAGDDFRTIDVALDSSGRIIVQTASNGERILSRYDDLGELDTSFGTDGRIAVEDEDGNPMSRMFIAVDGADRVVVSGWSSGATTVLRRYDDALSDDLPLPYDWTFYEAQAGPVAVDSLGRLFVSLWVGPDSNHDVTVARYTAAGLLDADFGTGGVAENFDDGDRDRPGPIAVDDEDRVVGAFAGQDSSPFYVRDVLVRWLGS